MKFYNPFKPHVCQFNNGKFAIRKYELFLGWVYLDQFDSETHWWHSPSFALDYATADDPSKLKYPSNAPLSSKYVKQV